MHMNEITQVQTHLLSLSQTGIKGAHYQGHACGMKSAITFSHVSHSNQVKWPKWRKDVRDCGLQTFGQAQTKPWSRLAPPTRNSHRSSTTHHHSLERLKACCSSHHLTNLLRPYRCGRFSSKPLPEWAHQVDWPKPAGAPQRSSKHLLILPSRHGALTPKASRRLAINIHLTTVLRPETLSQNCSFPAPLGLEIQRFRACDA